MEKNIFITRTITYAVKGREILRKNGIKAYVQRSFAADRIGCGYGIVAVGSVEKISSILGSAGIKIHDVKPFSNNANQ